MSKIGSILRQWRVEAGMTMRDAEKATGVSRTTISFIENGKQEPRDLTAGKLTRAYGRTLAELEERSTPLSLAWARAATDSEFHREITTAPDEDIELLNGLLGELGRFVHRPLKRAVSERNGKDFPDNGPEPGPNEYKPIKERFEALKAEMLRRRPPYARMRMALDGNKVFWFIPPEEWDAHREKVEKFFRGEPYEDVDARDESPVYAEALLNA